MTNAYDLFPHYMATAAITGIDFSSFFSAVYLNNDSFTLTSSLQANTFLVVDESHVMHDEVLSSKHSTQSTISILVG